MIHVDQQLVPGNARVVHHDVQASVPADGVVNNPLAGILARDIKLERCAPDPVGDLGQMVARGRNVHSHYRCSIPVQRSCN
ncbi:hypothetical protein D9M69_677450 [compost metagenome]